MQQQHSFRANSETRQTLIVCLKLALTAAFWGGTFVAGRVVAAEAAPFSAAFLRFVIASVFFLILAFKTDWRTVSFTPGRLFLLFLLGVTGVFGYNFFFFSGLQTISASRASLIIAANPVFIALAASLVFREKLGAVKVLGICVSIAGAAVVISRGDLTMLYPGKLGAGELYILGCVASWVAYSLLGKVALKNMPPLPAVTCACLIGTVCLLFPALHEGLLSNIGRYSIAVWLGVFYVGFFGTVLGFTWYYEGIRAIGPSRAGVFLNLVPVCAVLAGFFLLNESLDASLLIGAVFILAGVYITNRPV